MQITHKDATIEPVGTDDEFPGQFRVILSAPTLDRDGDTLLAEEWKQPLPDHITFDSDHGMSVATTVGSGTPTIDEETGNLIVEGTYSSLPRAQEVRTLVNEKHIRTTSVAFMTVPASKSASGKKERELLNGAFVAVPSNREALILSSKGVAPDNAKAGARNSKTDKERLEAILAAASELLGDDTDKSARVGVRKSIAGSVEALAERVRTALQEANEGDWVWIRGTVPDGDGGGTVVFEVEDRDTYETQLYEQPYTDDGTVASLSGDARAVGVTEVVTPAPDSSEASTSPDGTTEEPAAGAPAPAAGIRSAPSGDEPADEERELQEYESRMRDALIKAHH